MSYEIVEQRANYVAKKLERSVMNELGEYAGPIGAMLPIVTGKLDFTYKKFKLSYNHFSEKAQVDFKLSEDWKLYFDHKERKEGPEDKSGVQYSFKF